MEDLSSADLARALEAKVKLSPSYSAQLAGGFRTPSLELALRIESLLGIAPASWAARKASAERRRARKAA